MEALILSLPLIFCILSGLLIAWSFQVAACLFHIIFLVKQVREHARHYEMFEFILISAAIIAMVTLLFVATSFASLHMATIIFLELWYAIFLGLITSRVLSDEITVAEKIYTNSPHVINFHK